MLKTQTCSRHMQHVIFSFVSMSFKSCYAHEDHCLRHAIQFAPKYPLENRLIRKEFRSNWSVYHNPQYNEFNAQYQSKSPPSASFFFFLAISVHEYYSFVVFTPHAVWHQSSSEKRASQKNHSEDNALKSSDDLQVRMTTGVNMKIEKKEKKNVENKWWKA